MAMSSTITTYIERQIYHRHYTRLKKATETVSVITAQDTLARHICRIATAFLTSAL